MKNVAAFSRLSFTIAVLLFMAASFAEGAEAAKVAKTAKTPVKKTLARQTVLTAALKNDSAYLISQEETKSAYYEYLASFSSYLPTADLSYRFSKNRGPAAPIALGMREETTGEVYSFEGSWNVFNGFRSFSEMRAKRYAYLSAFEKERGERNLTALNVNRAFEDAIRTEYLLRSSRFLFESAELVLTESDLKLGLGALTMGDLYRAQADREKAYSNMLDAELTHLDALLELERISGLKIDFEAPFEDNTTRPKLMSVEEYASLAFKNNPDARRACYAEKSGFHTLNVQRGAFLPSVNLFANTNWTESRVEDSAENKYNTNSVGVLVSFNIFSGGRDLLGTLSQARKRESARITLTNTRRELKLKIESAVKRVDVNGRKTTSSESYVKAAEESYKAAQEMFRVGRATLPETVDARNELQNAISQLAEAKYALSLSYEDLNYLSGGSDAGEYDCD